MAFAFGPRRGEYIQIGDILKEAGPPLDAGQLADFEATDLLYRSLCALLYNYVPTSGHPGGSISSGHFVAAALFDAADYDVGAPDREDADIVSYAAGHKAMGLYSMWALRDELARVGDEALLPADVKQRLRFEDLLGFRRNPITATPLFVEYGSKALDGHPTPAYAVREAVDRRLRRRRRQLDRPRLRGARPLRQGCAARAHRRGRGRPHPGPRRRSAGRGGHRVARQRRHARRLEPGLDRQRQGVP